MKPRFLVLDLKRCTKCGEEKPTTEFRWQGGKCRSYCTECGRAYSRQYRLNNPERAKWGIRNATLKKLYGIGIDEYEKLLADQGGVCAICEEPPGVMRGCPETFRVDHDHLTGKVRGLLHHKCNAGIGMLHDDPRLLRKAADYLERGESDD